MPGSGHGLSRQYSTDTAECGWTSTTRVSLALWRLIRIVLTPDRGANQYITQVWQQTALTFDETLNVARSTADVIHAMSRDWPTDR